MRILERIPVSKNFFLDEFIDIKTYLESPCHGMNLIDVRLFAIAQFMRDAYGSSLVINTWWSTYKKYENKKPDKEIINIVLFNAGIRKASGLRPKNSTVGAKEGAHYIGKAIDLKGNARKLQDIVRRYAKKLYELGVRRMEDIGVASSWLHLDTYEKNTKPNSIRVVDKVKSTETIYF